MITVAVAVTGAPRLTTGITLAEYYILRDRSPFHGRVAWRRAVGRLGGRLADYIGGEGVVGKGVGV